MIAEEERAIRKDPIGGRRQLAKKAFGALGQKALSQSAAGYPRRWRWAMPRSSNSATASPPATHARVLGFAAALETLAADGRLPGA